MKKSLTLAQSAVQKSAFTLAEVFLPHPSSLPKNAFTLAEVLVTLGIIGVVSAMTVPSLMQNYQRQSYVTQLHKVYNEFSQAAANQMTSKYALTLSEAGVKSQDQMSDFIKSNFKIAKDCTGDPSKCLGTDYKNMNGASVTAYSDTTASCYVLASGASICAKYDPSSLRIAQDRPTGQVAMINPNHIAGLLGDLIIDVNGSKGPNIFGRDLFITGIYSDGSVKSALTNLREVALPGQTLKSNTEKCKQATKIQRQTDGSYCFDVLTKDNWQMNY